jgi:TRAP-type C4-dicarboxylate transport system substrate-binding protein
MMPVLASPTSAKRALRLARLALAATLLGAPLAVCAQTRWDLPTAYPLSNFHTVNIELFAKDVDHATGGRLKITVHPNASLLKLPEIKRGVQTAQVPAGEILLSAHANEDPLYGLDAVPFLASSYKDAARLMRASRKALEEKFARQGMRLLFQTPWPPQGIFSSKPIASVADLKGLKWRAYNPATARIAELVAAQPVTIQAAELSQALATGVVQSYISSAATGYDTKTYESLKYFYDTKAWLPRNAVLVGQRAWAALDRATQEAVLRSASEAETRGWALSEEKDRWYMEQLGLKGMKVETPSAQLAADMKKVGEVMTTEWLKTAGAEGEAILAAYRR